MVWRPLLKSKGTLLFKSGINTIRLCRWLKFINFYISISFTNDFPHDNDDIGHLLSEITYVFQEESAEEDGGKGKAGKNAAKSSAAKTKTADQPKTRGGARSKAGRKKRPNTAEGDDQVPPKRPYFNFSGHETLCRYVLNYILENRQ